MKQCVNCNKISTDEDVKEYEYESVVLCDETSKNGTRDAYRKTNNVLRESCPECGGIVEDYCS